MTNYDAIPKELQALPQWVVYRLPDKIPLQANGERARTNDSSTWATFGEVKEAVGFDGIGFVFTENDPYCGIDLDHCINAGKFTEEKKKWVRHFNSYSEVSPSGKGIHITVKGKLPAEGSKKGDYECYDRRRYFTFTGRHLKNTPLEVKWRQKELEKFHTEVFGPLPEVKPIPVPMSAPFMSDEEVIKKAFAAENGAKFAALWNGNTNGYPSPSEADLALCNHLAFWTAKNVAQMDGLFRKSKLYRDKWDEHRGEKTYGQIAIEKAIASGEVYKSPIKKEEVKLPKETTPEEPPPISLPEFMKKDIPPIEYYISGLLPKKGKGMISAQANIGKSMLAQNLALAMTCGKGEFLEKFGISPARVLYLDLEMGESALKERFQKMCAQENLRAENLYVKYLPSINLMEKDDRKLCERWLADLEIEVFIIDPLGNAWFGNENAKEEVSQLTGYLNGLIGKYGLSILVIHHWRKVTKEHKTGGQMAAGSYWWEAWLDCHLTLEGTIKSSTFSCQKTRNMPRFNPFLAKVNEEILWFEYLADYEKKFDEDTLIKLFETFGSDKVAIPKLIKEAKEQKVCSEKTVRKLIGESTLFEVDKSERIHTLGKKALDTIVAS